MIEYTSPKSLVGSWTQARGLCRKEGGTLADLHANKMEAVRALPNHSEFWVGLYRNTSWAWHTGRCTTINRGLEFALHIPDGLNMHLVCLTQV